MYVIRSARLEDFDALFALSSKVDFGMTNLSKTREKIKAKIVASLEAFQSYTRKANQQYLFLLEDLGTRQIGGCCGIFSNIAHANKACYKLESVPQPHVFDDPLPEISILTPQLFNLSASEVCALYMLPEWRQKGIGKLLSFSRLLFMALFPERFQNKIVAEIRGCITSPNEAPFWDGIGKKLCGIPFSKIYALNKNAPETALKLMPKYPIYLPLLPELTQNAVGQPHPLAEPALKMLRSQGFRSTNLIDPFDGGPWIEADRHNVGIIRATKTDCIAKIEELDTSSSLYKGLICNGKLDFRSCIGAWTRTPAGLVLTPQLAETLQVAIGEKVSYVEDQPHSRT